MTPAVTPPGSPDTAARACLARLALFGQIAPAALDRVAGQCAWRSTVRGELLFQVGEPCTAMHVVVDGLVKIVVNSPGGQDKVLEIIRPGDTFGEALMFLDKPYVVQVLAVLPSRLLCIPRQAVADEVHRDGRFAMEMLAGLSRRLHGLVQDVQAYTLQSGRQRLVGLLLRMAAEQPFQQAEVLTVTLPASKATMASRLSVTPEYFSRVLRELEDDGVIEICRRHLHILDLKALAAQA